MMDVLLPATLDEALQQKAERPDALPIAGGTDVMVDINFGRLRPQAIMDLSRLEELRSWRRENGEFFLGAGVTYTHVVKELADFIPLVQASRSVGSPQIRNRGTVGGNLATASPAGDTLPVLAAYDAQVVLGSKRGSRTVDWRDFLQGPKKTSIAPDELILGARWRPLRGAGSFSKIGTRNAMVISVAGLCLVFDEDQRQVRVALGSVGPTIIRANEAESFISAALGEGGVWQEPSTGLGDTTYAQFAELVGKAARPINDVRGTAAYRVHACRVLAGRALRWALEERRLRRWL
jgi:CO/xanthine dehydrogenase FAD-binding subunit